MVRSLYARILATHCLLLIAGGFLFWLLAVPLDWTEPFAVIGTLTFCGIGAAVVTGLLLHPFDGVHQALIRLAAGEPGPLPEAPTSDLRALVVALSNMQARLVAAPAAGPANAAASPDADWVETSVPTPDTPAPAGERAGGDDTELLGVLNSLSDGVMICDATMRPLVVNTALRVLAADEVDAATAEAQGPAAYRHAFHARCFVPDQLAVVEETVVKGPEKPRTDIIHLERPTQFLKRYSAPLYNARRELTGLLVSYTDITQEVVMDRLRQDFISNASHELRTPVTSVKLLLENLQDGAKEDPKFRDIFIDDAAREMDRMHDLVNDLLDIAALESGRNQLHVTRFPLDQVIKDAVSTVTPQAKHRDVAVVTDWPEGLEMEADMARVRQVLVNLVTNAVKFTPAGGSVTLKAWTEGTAVRFSIADTGIGIPAKDLPHIFDRFFRVTRGRSRLQGGSGLGLTIVKQAIDAHDGEIHVESTEGQGTTFFISLPHNQEARV